MFSQIVARRQCIVVYFFLTRNAVIEFYPQLLVYFPS